MPKAKRYVAIPTDSFLQAAEERLKDHIAGSVEGATRRSVELIQAGALAKSAKRSPARMTARKK